MLEKIIFGGKYFSEKEETNMTVSASLPKAMPCSTYLISFTASTQNKQQVETIVRYDSSGMRIYNSSTVSNPLIVYEFIEENRGYEIAGSTEGLVFEWLVHSVAYPHLVFEYDFDSNTLEYKLLAFPYDSVLIDIVYIG